MEGTTTVNTDSPKWTAAKFWVAFVAAMLNTATLIGFPNPWGKVIGIVLLFVTAGMVYVWPNRQIGTNSDAQPVTKP